ncbi:hypothetical protein [Agromyces seonyuensis]|uniref:Uncharacterized protein n=1 Tax=Agromyces seonyuensis TaxID=2662446 RepID=A0A6I4NUP5_9MICO|nr:hypothetical protein [Agromyces seonyuensis]MWB98176.1 hypothetical protein [Agromyces seonyuensis]
MPTGTIDPQPLGRTSWTVLIALAVLCLLAGIQPLMGTAVAWFPYVAVPAAIGLPFLLPALRPVPVGETTWLLWAVDLVAVAVLLVTAWVLLRAAVRKRPFPRPARAFGRALGVTVLAVMAANLVRGVAYSFVLHADLGTFLGTTAANLVFSALFGAAFGILVGIAVAIAAATARRPAVDDSPAPVSAGTPAPANVG